MDKNVRPSQILAIATWFGLASGLLEGLLTLALRELPGFAIRIGEQILWVAPLFNLILFVLIALGFVVLLRFSPRSPGAGAIIALYTAILALGILLRLGKVNEWVSVFLSLGIGLQAERILRSREDRAFAFLRRTLAVLVGVVLVVGLAGALWGAWRERSSLAQLPPPSPSSPNVVLIVFDTLRADHLGAYGYNRATSPNLDRIAGRGVLFEHAFSNSSWTLPSHASLFTGRLPHEHKADWRTPMSGEPPVLAESFQASGYRTAGFSGNTSYVSPEWGLSRGFIRFRVYGNTLVDYWTRTAFGVRIAKVFLPRLGYFDIPGRKRAADVNREFLSWVDEGNRGARPFFAFLNYMDVHDPYLIHEPYRSRFSPDATRGDAINFQFQPNAFRRKPTLTAAEIQREVNGYDACLAYLDAQIGALFAELGRRELVQNTLVIIASDHGEAFGNHNLFGHGNSLYLETLHVPLILFWPEHLPAGVRVRGPVGLHQIPTTLRHLVGLAGLPFPGTSLVDSWAQGAAPSEEAVISELSRVPEGPVAYPVSRGSLKSVITNQWHLIVSGTGEEELYAWPSDPEENQNLATSPERREVIAELKRRWSTSLRLPPRKTSEASAEK